MLTSKVLNELKGMTLTEKAMHLNGFVSGRIEAAPERQQAILDVFHREVRLKLPELLSEPLDYDAFYDLVDSDAEPQEVPDTFDVTPENRYRFFTQVECDGVFDFAPGKVWVNRVRHVLTDRPFYLDCIFSEAAEVAG